ANVGIYTVLAARRAVEGRVVAFEPDPAARAELERNVRLNGLANVEVRAEAVGDACRQAWLSVGLDSRNHVVAGDGAGRPVAMVALDGALGPAVPAIVKV